MTRYKLRLSGPGARGARVSATLLRSLLDALVDGVQQSLRLRVEGTSVTQGKVPAWIRKAAAFDVVGLQAGSTILVLEAPRLVDAAPDRFSQGEMFTPLDPNRTSIELFGESLGDALASNQDSELFDDGLVQTFESLDATFRQDVETIEFVDGPPVRMDKNSIDTLRRLRTAIPSDQQVVVAGKLDSLRHSDRFFTLLLSTGEAVRGVALGGRIEADDLAGLWGKPARVSGVAKFRPSGSVLRLEAEAIGPATEQDLALWSVSPGPLTRSLDSRSLQRPQGSRSGLAAVIGQWPGDESDQEILDALERLS